MSKLIVFDVDGTFLDSIRLFEKVVAEYSREQKLPQPNFEAIKHGYGNPHDHDFGWGVSKEKQLQHMNGAFTLLDRYLMSEDPHYSPQLFQGTKESFTHLQDLGHTLAIITSKSEKPLLHALELHDLGKHFTAYRTYNDIKRRGEQEKPAPDMLHSIMRELKFVPDETVMIGDTTMDIRMGRAAATSTIGVTWGAHPKEHLVDAGAHHVIETEFNDIVHTVKKNLRLTMTVAHLLLILLFLLTIGHLLTLKICSVKLDHRTAPIFISLWSLLGIAAVSPHFGYLWAEGWQKFMAHPYLLALCIVKGGLLYLLLVISLELMRESLSSRHFVTPLSIGLMAIVNATLGEELQLGQWIAALGLCGLSAAFFFRGHLSDLSRQGKMTYIKLVSLSVCLAALDHVLTKNSNWFSLLLVSNVVLFGTALALNHKRIAVLKDALFHKSAALAGIFYMATDLLKFYQQVTINPVTVVVTAQAATKPVILILSALLWKERTVKEQLIWGILAFIITLPLFL